MYPRDTIIESIRYSDANWTGRSIDKKSTLGGCFYLGNSWISWYNKKSSSKSLSIVEVELLSINLDEENVIKLCHLSK